MSTLSVTIAKPIETVGIVSGKVFEYIVTNIFN